VKNKKKPRGIKHKIREEKKREQRIGLTVTVAILIIVISVSGFLINSMLNQPSTNQTTSNTSQPKAAIVDQLSLTIPNQTFVETAIDTLEQAGYTVDYYPGENVTVEFYRNLPTYGYGLIVLRGHAAINPSGEYVTLFTSELYSEKKYSLEQLDDRFGIVHFLPYNEGDPKYFGIPPRFIEYNMNGRFQNTKIIMMGCDGLRYTLMAEAFIKKGARIYVSWNGPVSASHTDLATAHLLQHFLVEKLTLKEAVIETFNEVGFDPAHKTLLIYYPLEAGEQTIGNITVTQQQSHRN
jgi:hypothetical protein